jgi:hypothetical protein
MKRTLARLSLVVLACCAAPAEAACHLFFIDQVFSNADGTIQYVVMTEMSSANGEHFWAGQSLRTTGAAGTKQFPFPANLPSSATANRSVLIGTSGLAALGVIALDYTMQDGFIPTGGGTLSYSCNGDQISLAGLPTDGATAMNRTGTAVPATPKNFAGITVPLTLPPPAAGGPDLNQHGLTGSWFEPATSGQGIELEFYPNFPNRPPGTAFVQGAWFTFDVAPSGGAERERWYTFSGDARSGMPSVPVTIFRNVDGNFDAPPMTNATPVGSGTLAFADCNNATLDYAFSDGRPPGSIPLTRLVDNVTCTVGTAPGTNADFAFSGNWYDPATSGQGFVFEVNPIRPFVFLTWYTYAPTGPGMGAAGQRWFTGQVAYAPGSRSITMPLFQTTGGLFDQPNPAPATDPVGTATVTFLSCSSAQIHYDFTAGSSAGKSRTIALTRIGPIPPGCPAAMDSAAMPGMGYGDYGPP